MNEVRMFCATAIFCLSTYFVFDLFVYGFNWTVFIVCVVGYVSVHYLWPKNNKGYSDWLDWLELIVDLPFRTLAFCLRSVGKLFRGGNGDIDLDL